MKKLMLAALLLLFFTNCEEDSAVPKPPTYLRSELPDHQYGSVSDSCPILMEIPTMFSYKVLENKGNVHKGLIDMGPLNGSIYLHYWEMNEPLSYYVNNANDEVDRHKVKANRILDNQLIRSTDSVFGTFFELQGDVATPFQFYLTDSTSHFAYAEVLFNSTPNYDSLKPSLDYLKADLDHILESIKWKK